LQVSNAPTNGYVLTARSAATGDMTWEDLATSIASLSTGASYFIQQTSINITGTITDSYFLSLAYELTGDVTLSGDTIFAKMIDGTTDISITNDGSDRTLSGSGTLLLNSVLFN